MIRHPLPSLPGAQFPSSGAGRAMARHPLTVSTAIESHLSFCAGSRRTRAFHALAFPPFPHRSFGEGPNPGPVPVGYRGVSGWWRRLRASRCWSVLTAR